MTVLGAVPYIQRCSVLGQRIGMMSEGGLGHTQEVAHRHGFDTMILERYQSVL